jgi:hypothetical protein
MGHPQQHMRVEGHHWWQAGGVAEGVNSEVGERQQALAEVVAVKVASGESRSGRSAWKCSVDRGVVGKHEEENMKGKPSALSSQRL